jgi:hypothetical protein
MVQDTNKQPRVLIVSHSDGFLEVFVDGRAEVRIARMPAAHSLEAERTAEDVFELLLPPQWRGAWDRSKLKAVGTTKPLMPSAIVDAFATRETAKDIDSLPMRIRQRCKIARERRTA